jgi:hypothetical protein
LFHPSQKIWTRSTSTWKIKSAVLRFFLILLLSSASSIPAVAVELLRDHHTDTDYVFQTNQPEVTATIE